MEVQVEGLRELEQLLRQTLPDHIQTKALHPALTKAARPIIAEARSLVPVKTGKIRRAIYSYRDRDSTKVRAVRSISVRSGRRFGEQDAFYWKFVEFGRGESTVGLKRGEPNRGARARSLGTPAKGFFGKTVKPVPARPFMRPAFEAKKFAAVEEFKRHMGPEIQKVATRYQRQLLRKLKVGFR